MSTLRCALLAYLCLALPLTGCAAEDAYGKKTPVIVGVDVSLLEFPRNVVGVQCGVFGTVAEYCIGIQAQLLGTAIEPGMANFYVAGVQASLMFSAAATIYGVQVGLASSFAGDVYGIQAISVLNYAYRNVYGVQASLFTNGARNALSGLQIAPINRAGEVNGLQIGLLNNAGTFGGLGAPTDNPGRVRGCQIGLYNEAGPLQGIQIGLINRTVGRTFLPLTIGINVGW